MTVRGDVCLSLKETAARLLLRGSVDIIVILYAWPRIRKRKMKEVNDRQVSSWGWDVLKRKEKLLDIAKS